MIGARRVRALAAVPPVHEPPLVPDGRGLACLRGERMVFEGLGFDLAPGGALVLTGPNGSGKTSFLRLVAGLLRPAAGSLAWRGRPVSDDPDALRTELHYVGHLDAVKPLLTVSENLVFWARMRGGATL